MYYEEPEAIHLRYLDESLDDIERPDQNNEPFPGSAFPITEDYARMVFAEIGADYDADIAKPMTREAMREYTEKQILPAMKHLSFMGIEPLPDIRVIAPWSKTDNGDILGIRYPDFVPSEDLTADEVNEVLDIALANACEGELPATIGHISLDAFAGVISTFFVMIGKSTTAHRRYKNAFIGEQMRLIFHAEYNHVELIMPGNLMEALDDSVKAFLHGR